MSEQEQKDPQTNDNFFNRNSGLLSFIGGILTGSAIVFVFVIERISDHISFDLLVAGNDAIQQHYVTKGGVIVS